jgi:hypothetical protein
VLQSQCPASFGRGIAPLALDRIELGRNRDHLMGSPGVLARLGGLDELAPHMRPAGASTRWRVWASKPGCTSMRAPERVTKPIPAASLVPPSACTCTARNRADPAPGCAVCSPFSPDPSARRRHQLRSVFAVMPHCRQNVRWVCPLAPNSRTISRRSSQLQPFGFFRAYA